KQLACTIQRGNGENTAFYSSQYVTRAGAQAAERRGADAPRHRCQRQLSVASGQKNRLRPLRWRLRPSAYELLSICARSSAIEPNFTVPCGNLASIDPSL